MDIHETIIERIDSADPDRYRASGFADAQARARLLVLYGFHLELAKIPELVSEPMIGEIRYQWWRDCVDEIYTDRPVRSHEIATPLSAALTDRNITRFHVDKLIDGRARDLDPTPFADIEAACDYARETSGRLMLIAAHMMGNDVNDKAVMMAGEAWGLTGLARAWGYYHKTMLSNLDYADLCAAAQAAYDSAKAALSPLPVSLFPAVGYGALIPGFLKRLQTPQFDPLKHRVSYGALSKQSRLLLSSLRGKL